jgi:hypothetical protein
MLHLVLPNPAMMEEDLTSERCVSSTRKLKTEHVKCMWLFIMKSHLENPKWSATHLTKWFEVNLAKWFAIFLVIIDEIVCELVGYI